jgi:hypothetical protein
MKNFMSEKNIAKMKSAINKRNKLIKIKNFYFSKLKFIILIQKTYKKYKLNKKVKIYKQLPYEIKSYIVFISRENERYQQYKKLLEKILINKFNNFFKLHFESMHDFAFLSSAIKNYDNSNPNHDDFKIIGPKVLHNFYLIVKYNKILLYSNLFHDQIYDNATNGHFYFPSICQKMLMIAGIILITGKKSFTFFDNYHLHENINKTLQIFTC